MAKDPTLERAIQAAGGVRSLARSLAISGAAVSAWRQVPAGRVLEVARITGIPARELRPDLAAAFESVR